MTVAKLIITHNGIGQSLIDTAASMLANNDLPVTALSVPANLQPQDLGYYADQIRNHIVDLNSTRGVLILTDICGATPNNLARYFAEENNVEVISGLNLPMLIRVLNYGEKPLDELVEIALDGGRTGIRQDTKK